MLKRPKAKAAALLVLPTGIPVGLCASGVRGGGCKAHQPISLGWGAPASAPLALWRPDADTGTSKKHPHPALLLLRSKSQGPTWTLFQK